MQRILLANRSQRVRENAAAKLAEEDAAAKAGKAPGHFLRSSESC